MRGTGPHTDSLPTAAHTSLPLNPISSHHMKRWHKRYPIHKLIQIALKTIALLPYIPTEKFCSESSNFQVFFGGLTFSKKKKKKRAVHVRGIGRLADSNTQFSICWTKFWFLKNSLLVIYSSDYLNDPSLNSFKFESVL